MQTKTFSKLAGALAYLFGKIKASEDSGHVVIVAFWLGKYWILAETHLTKHALDEAKICRNCHGLIGVHSCNCDSALPESPRQ